MGKRRTLFFGFVSGSGRWRVWCGVAMGVRTACCQLEPLWGRGRGRD